MSLISKNDLITASGLSKIGFLKNPVASAVMSIAKINEVNRLYDKLKDKEGKDFFDSFVRERNLSYIAFEEDLAKIPKTGPFILVSNHPLGAIDGILMCKILSEVRPDFKVMGNFLLEKIKPMEPYVISVNPFENRKEAHSSTSGMRETLKHLQNGGCVGIFPAGEVSNKNNPYGEILDKEWEKPALKLIRMAKVPVVPLYFHAKNSRIFYQVAKLHPSLQTLMLPAEMMNDREKPIRIRIGKPITLKAMDEMETIEELGEFLKRKVYMMKSYYEKRKSLAQSINLKNLTVKFPLLREENIVQNIIDETPKEDILKDINRLRGTDKMLFSNGNYEIYFTTYEEIPSVMREIGRQRELTFRAVGEGSNLPFDLDEYDKHYHHLFLWDNSAEKLAGAYRMALGKDVMKKYGIKGFYTSSLFEFEQDIHPFFKKVIEMGRAYISEEYQQKPLPLFLLWRGIVHVCLRNSDHKFLMGGVSISNKFSEFSKSLMIEFMRSNYFDSAVAQYITPKNEYKVKLRDRDKNIFFEEMESDLNKLDKIIDDLEPELRLPVLIKKYIKQNAKVIAFNVDPNFNDAIDGLMYIRISDLPESTIKPVLEEMSDHIRKEQENNSAENQ
ncbi:lysophospholipid acyltransferase family protein [Chryseobacterium carnipullorum]|uniref:Acyltransferase n=2 Tax=Chryseobacterium TaxID=59732 RepID=A0A1M7FR78_CHRCU|nr:MULTISPECIES: lysophospholipid acyltransferase family protein [Chryseobacterium]MDN5478745.1 lysophospholipid acyltransferase family protein [Chryseobacterium sp.]AZA49079.1 lysophospholipid acyltransferase family protein [Chryseobacterium carnipullorum]AZA63974.1 lysophospholipid acyltransferase family protein [Chryseobacterium carnipullorum]PQA91115.1 glycerol acyltransferase [Chryseobacterium shigense]SHM06189.1 Acyltransferase [Chryseobacterium carnipullorum]